MIIYKIQNKINNKIYIGLTSKDISKRIAEHIYTDYLIGKALRKYGLESFDISIIDNADTIDILYEKEKYWIKFYNCKNPNGYNLTDGGDGKLGCKTTNKTKKLMSKNRKGRTPWNKGLTKEIDNRVARVNLTKEHRDKIKNR